MKKNKLKKENRMTIYDHINKLKSEIQTLNPISEPLRFAFLLTKILELIEQEQKQIDDLTNNQKLYIL